jgi:hypothetical protein
VGAVIGGILLGALAVWGFNKKEYFFFAHPILTNLVTNK